jgi:hypothetical protein
MDGAVVQSHQISIARHPNYNDDLDELMEMATSVLKDAIEDFNNTEPWAPPTDPDDDERDKGLGF